MDIRKDDNLLVTDALRRRLDAEGLWDDGHGHWWCCTTRTGDVLVKFKSSPLVLSPASDQIMFAHDMTWALNKHLHHDGKWIVAYTHPMIEPLALSVAQTTPYYRWVFIWVDNDGDPQFSMENDGLFVETLLAGPDHWMNQAEEAWNKWRYHMRDVLGEKRMKQISVKRAQGEPGKVTPPMVH